MAFLPVAFSTPLRVSANPLLFGASPCGVRVCSPGPFQRACTACKQPKDPDRSLRYSDGCAACCLAPGVFGDVLAYHMLHPYFGMKPAGVWVSGQRWLLVPLCWTTVLFEASVPLLIWWRRTNPWLLAVGVLMHLGIRVFMNVGPFSYVALAAYPALLHPEVARRLYERARETRMETPAEPVETTT